MLAILQNLDWSILHWIHNTLSCGALDFLMPKISALCDVGAIWLSAAILMLFSKKYRRYGIMLVFGIAAGYVIGNLFLKPLIARPRPCWLDSSVQMLIPAETDFSFPSGHALASAIGATILTMANRKFAFAAIPLAALIAFSRLYLYVHFPSDVLGGALLGILIGYFTVVVGRRFFERLEAGGAKGT